MVLGRLFHYAADAVLVSTILAGVKRSSGFTPQTNSITDPTTRTVVDRYLGIGETIFDMIQGTVVNSQYFRRS